MSIVPSTSIPNGVEPEVDFYRNPTELFRWVNYRRWEGAQNRALTCPEEVKTWIVSTDQNTNQIQWRHLPLHLCCMQSQIPVALLETMVRIFPESTQRQDHDGMTALHLACVKGGITEQVAMILLSYNPGAVCTTDNHNRTPLDLLQMSISAGAIVGPDAKQVTLLLARTEQFLTEIKASVREEEVKRLNQVHASVSTERVASQQVITRLENELEKAKETIETLAAELANKDELEGDLEHKIVLLQKQLNDGLDEREKLEKKLESLKTEMNHKSSKLDEHDKEVEEVRTEMRLEIERIKLELDNAQTEAATSKSMAEALEQQLKNKFAGAYSSSSKMRELELSLSEAAVKKTVMETEYNNKIDSLNRELVRAKETIEELTKYNLSLQEKMKDLSDSVSTILASQNIMSAEQDRLVENCRKYEIDMASLMEDERHKIASLIERQRNVLEEILHEQSRIMSSGSEAALQLKDSLGAERERCYSTIHKMKLEFEQAQAAERERKNQEAARRANARVTLPQLLISSPHGPHTQVAAQNGTSNIAAMSSPRPNVNSWHVGITTNSARNAQSPGPAGSTSRHPSSQQTSGNLSRMMDQRRSLELDDFSSNSSSASASSRGFALGNSFDQHWSNNNVKGPFHQSVRSPTTHVPPTTPTTPRSLAQKMHPTTPRSASNLHAQTPTPRSSNNYPITPRSTGGGGGALTPRSILQTPRQRPTQTHMLNRDPSPNKQKSSNSDATASLRSKPSLFDQRQDSQQATTPKSKSSRHVEFS